VKNSKKRILLPPAAKQLKSLAEFHAARREINWNSSRRTTCALYFAPRTAQMNLIVFCRDTCVEKSVADLPPRTAAKK